MNSIQRLISAGAERACTYIAAAVLLLSPNPAAAQFDPTNPIPAVIQHGPVRVDLRPVATGLVSPVLLISAPDTSKRIFIVEQTGQVWIYQNGNRLETPFIDVASRLVTLTPNFDERGLLGLAFDPDFTNPESPGFRRIFTYSSEPVSGTADLVNQYATTLNHHGVVASWRVDPNNPNVIDPTTRVELFRVDEPQFNHNGGTVAFGPDKLLYLGLGDGGGANDNNPNGHNPTIGNGQDPTIALGKMLRVDVNGTNSANGKYGIPSTNPFAMGGGVAEIFALGLRNPYRFSFDGNDLLVADVGQNRVEELNRVELGKNYGWRYKEGTFKFNTNGTISDDLTGIPDGLTDPILQYDHDEGISITGGYVYRGNAIPELRGKYVFGDFSKAFQTPTGRLFYADLTTGEIREFILGNNDAPLGLFVKGMGIDGDGEIYVLGSTIGGPQGTTGVALKLVPPAVFAKGGAVPGAGVAGSGVPADATFASFGVPAINDAGEMAFSGKYVSGEGGRAVILGPKGDQRSTFAVLLGTGDPAPDVAGAPISGATFASFNDPLLNNGGRVAFVGKMKGTPTSKDTGIWTNADTGILHLVAREGDPAPGVAGARFKGITSVAFGDGDASVLAFTASLTSGGVKGTNDSGLWLSSAGAEPVLVLREGQTIEIQGVELTVKSFKALTILPFASGQGNGVANGRVVAHLTFTNKSEALVQCEEGGDKTIIAATGDPILDWAFQGFFGATQNRAGRPSFIGRIQDIFTKKRMAVVSQAPDLSLEVVAQNGIRAPGTDGFFLGFDAVASNESGAAFLGTLVGGTTTGSTNSGLWWRHGSTPVLIARESGAAPDVVGGKFAAFKSIALSERANAGPLVLADLKPGSGVTAGNRTGLWVADDVGALHLVLRTGSPIQVGSATKTLRSLTVLSVVPGSPAQTRSINAGDQLIYRAFFTDGSQAILTATLP
jgi:glucose/arabinose dehydrogenase